MPLSERDRKGDRPFVGENQRGRESFLDLQEEIEEVDGNAGGRPPALWKGTKGSGIFS